LRSRTPSCARIARTTTPQLDGAAEELVAGATAYTDSHAASEDAVANATLAEPDDAAAPQLRSADPATSEAGLEPGPVERDAPGRLVKRVCGHQPAALRGRRAAGRHGITTASTPARFRPRDRSRFKLDPRSVGRAYARQ
jgi:hypothetical protein